MTKLGAAISAMMLSARAAAQVCTAGFDVFDNTSSADLTIYRTFEVSTSDECCQACSKHGADCGAWLFQPFTASKNHDCSLANEVGYIYDGFKEVEGKITGVRRQILPETPQPPAPKGRKPNIIVMLTDDQDVRLGSMVAMPYTMAHVAHAGVNMSNFHVNTPICCPSRSTILSGRHYHNNKARTAQESWKKGMCMHMNVSQTLNPGWWQNSFVHALYYDSGYATGLFGKVLNDMSSYGCTEGTKVSGVDRLFAMCKVDFYNVLWADQNGPDSPKSGLRRTGGEPGNYSTSLLGNASLAWIKSIVESGPNHRPFFAWLGPHAPHLPSTPAKWYKDHPVGNTPVPKEIYYNYEGVGKHSFIPTNPSIGHAEELAIADEHSKRLRSLLSVDDIIREHREYLVSTGEWDNTILIMTSDHGYSLGQFRIASHKTQVYDHNTKVPFVMRGPGLLTGATVSIPVSFADVAPTLLELAGQTGFAPTLLSDYMDGMSFAEHVRADVPAASPWVRDTLLIEYQSIHPMNDGDKYPGCPSPSYHDGPNNTFSAIRVLSEHENLLYAEFADVTNPHAWDFAEDTLNFVELYNVTEDYYMLKNIYGTAPPDLKKSLRDRLKNAIQCNGRADCKAALSSQHSVSSKELVV